MFRIRRPARRGVLSGLDARVATLTGPGQVLEYATATVGDLERPAAAATADLERLAQTKSKLEHEFVSIRSQLQALTVSTSTASRRVRKTTRPVQRWIAGFATLAVLALLGTVVMRSRDQRVAIAATTHAVQRDSPVSRPPSALPSRTVGFTTFAMPIDRPGLRISRMPASAAASGSRPATGSKRRPAGVGTRAVRSRPVLSTRTPRTTAPSPATRPATDAVDHLIGMLEIESVPPGAAVFINQERVGETPLQLTRLRAGSHVLWLEHEGYDRWTSAVLVQADTQGRVSASLQPVR